MERATVHSAWARRMALVAPLIGARLGAQEDPARGALELALREYLTTEQPRSAQALEQLLHLARGAEDLLAEIVTSKSFVAPTEAVALRGTIDARYRFVPGAQGDNPALLHGPATGDRLHPLVVYVPDDLDSAGREAHLPAQATARGWYVFLVPDERQDNLWSPGVHEHRRHVGPLRDLLLGYPIDPDRVYLIGSGRGGHAAWDVGLTSAGLWAALYPCNGGLIHEGGFDLSGGVFLENARSLAVFTVYNTSFDHGIESCRHAARRFAELGYRFEAVEEPDMRQMGLVEATSKLAPITRDAHPRTLFKRFNHLADGEHYWLRALDRKPREWDPSAKVTIRGPWPAAREEQLELLWEHTRKECALLDAKIEGQRIEIVARGLGRLRVYLDPVLLDYGSKVTIVINGRAEKPIIPVRRAEVMLRHLHETGDTSRLYWASVDCAVSQ